MQILREIIFCKIQDAKLRGDRRTVKIEDFETLICTRKLTLTLFWQKFRESNICTKEVI